MTGTLSLLPGQPSTREVETLEPLPISVLVLTRDEEANLDRCLSAVAGLCGEIHVVDSGSTDRTEEIARSYTSSIHHHPYSSHGTQLDWCLRNLPFTYDWIMMLDADNIVTPALAAELRQTFSHHQQDVNAFYVRYRQHFRGRPVRGFKSTNLLLFRRHEASVDVGELVDHRLVVHGRIARLRGELLHDNVKESDLDFWIDKHQTYASRLAVEEVLRRQGRIKRTSPGKLWGSPDQRRIWMKDRWYGLPLYLRPFLYFGYRYILRLGVLDGRNGLLFHFLHALWFRLLVDARISDLERALSRTDCEAEQLMASAAEGAALHEVVSLSNRSWTRGSEDGIH